MQFTIDVSIFQKALHQIKAGTSKCDSSAAYVLLEVTIEEGMRLTSAKGNLWMTATTTESVTVVREGKMPIHYSQLAQVLKNLRGGLLLEKENQSLKISCQEFPGCCITLAGGREQDIPRLPSFAPDGEISEQYTESKRTCGTCGATHMRREVHYYKRSHVEKEQLHIKQSVFAHLLKEVVYRSSKSVLEQYDLPALRMELRDDLLMFAVADRAHFVRSSHPVVNAGSWTAPVHISAHLLAHLVEAFPPQSELLIELVWTEQKPLQSSDETEEKTEIPTQLSHLCLKTEQMLILCALEQKQFPPYEELLTKVQQHTYSTRFICNPSDLSKTLRALLPLSSTDAVWLHVHSGKLIVEACSILKKQTMATFEVTAETEGQESLLFSAPLLLAFLKRLNAPQVMMEFTDESIPGRLTPSGKQEHLLYLLMPMSIQQHD